jgi:hypothetical protein
MNRWIERPIEVQRLLNPSFCSLLLWHSARTHEETSPARIGIAFEECFLVLPIVLHRETRESLPPRTTTSLTVWLGRNPLAPSTIADRARSLVPFTKEALRFAGAYGLVQFRQMLIHANPDWRRRMASALEGCSDEVRACAKRAEFLGKWFAKTGNAETVLSLLGVQP